LPLPLGVFRVGTYDTNVPTLLLAGQYARDAFGAFQATVIRRDQLFFAFSRPTKGCPSDKRFGVRLD
jgi:hypothetical protein